MKGQNGVVLVTGDCAVLFRSSKQKINTRSSTESELLVVDDACEKGYDLETHLKKDNHSTMLVMKNGKLSAGKRTKHFDIRYYYVKDFYR